MREVDGKHFAWSVKVGEKGQFVIPKEARELFGINPGDTLLLLGELGNGLAIPPKGAFEHLVNATFKKKDNGGND